LQPATHNHLRPPVSWSTKRNQLTKNVDFMGFNLKFEI
jgi:hypothetical protein